MAVPKPGSKARGPAAQRRKDIARKGKNLPRSAAALKKRTEAAKRKRRNRATKKAAAQRQKNKIFRRVAKLTTKKTRKVYKIVKGKRFGRGYDPKSKAGQSRIHQAGKRKGQAKRGFGVVKTG